MCNISLRAEQNKRHRKETLMEECLNGFDIAMRILMLMHLDCKGDDSDVKLQEAPSMKKRKPVANDATTSVAMSDSEEYSDHSTEA